MRTPLDRSAGASKIPARPMSLAVPAWPAPKTAVRLALLVTLLGAAAGTVSAQEYVGPKKCRKGCRAEGKKGLLSHEKTLAQLAEPNAATYAKATGGNAK